jgi:hypothetical protein
MMLVDPGLLPGKHNIPVFHKDCFLKGYRIRRSKNKK